MKKEKKFLIFGKININNLSMEKWLLKEKMRIRKINK